MSTFICRLDDGTEVDVSEDVSCLYDLLIHSMDWGSGFLDVEDSLHAVRIGELGGFGEVERARSYVDAQVQSEEQQRFLREHPDASAWPPQRLLSGAMSGLLGSPAIEHEHVYSTVGKCMWRGCDSRGPADRRPIFRADNNYSVEVKGR
jgi:hypothetical protein